MIYCWQCLGCFDHLFSLKTTLPSAWFIRSFMFPEKLSYLNFPPVRIRFRILTHPFGNFQLFGCCHLFSGGTVLSIVNLLTLAVPVLIQVPWGWMIHLVYAAHGHAAFPFLVANCFCCTGEFFCWLVLGS